MEIEIFESEMKDGLEEKIKNSRIVFSSLLYPATTDIEVLNLPQKVVATNLNQPDLYYLNTVLVTTGWNNNDDVFGRDETWKARHSPEDKRINLDHKERDIVGHITGNFVVDNEWNVIDDNTKEDDLPSKFHIVTNAVVYRHWEDEEFQAKINDFIAEIERGEWYDAMECLGRTFDYAFIDSKGNQTVVKRNKETAFLTKYLRVMGGDGTYKGRKIGRYLRGFIFSGKGFTRKPANPESIIINEASVQAFAASSFLETIQEDNEMADVKELQPGTILRAEPSISLKEHEEKLGALQAKLEDLNEKAVASKIAAFENVTKAKETEVAELSKKLEASETKVTELSGRITVLAEENTKLSAQVKAVEDEKRTLSRVSLLVKAGKTEEDAKKLVSDSLAKLDDASFECVVTIMAESLKAVKAAEETAKKSAVEDPEVDPAELNAKASELTKTEPEVVITTSVEENKFTDELEAYFATLFNAKDGE